MPPLTHAFRLAMSDYWHERLLSACAVLGLAAVLAPLMVLSIGALMLFRSSIVPMA